MWQNHTHHDRFGDENVMFNESGIINNETEIKQHTHNPCN